MKKLIILMCFLLLTSCQSVQDEADNNEPKASINKADFVRSEPEEEKAFKLLDRIKLKLDNWLEYDDIEVLDQYRHHHLIRSQMKTYADRYFLYNEVRDLLLEMPLGGELVSSYKILDEDTVSFMMAGKHNESDFHGLPYILECKRAIVEGKESFIPERKDYLIPLSESLSFGNKDNHQVKDIKVTLEGIQVLFGPEDENDPMYFADYTNVPRTQTSFDEETLELSFEFKGTSIDENLSLESLEGNHYIASINLEESNDALILRLKLHLTSGIKVPEFYKLRIIHSMRLPAALDLRFYEEY